MKLNWVFRWNLNLTTLFRGDIYLTRVLKRIKIQETYPAIDLGSSLGSTLLWMLIFQFKNPEYSFQIDSLKVVIGILTN